MDSVESYVAALQGTLNRLPWDDIRAVIAALHDARLAGRQVFVMGNGGSAATASHFACDLGKGAALPGYPLFRVIALTDNMPVFSAYANDCGYEHVFARQLENLLQPDDLVIGISGSGNSPNVLNAIELARQRGATTIALVGFDGGRLKEMVDLCIHVGNDCMEQVEDVHVILAHLMASVLRQLLLEPHCLLSAPQDEEQPVENEPHATGCLS